MTTVGFLDRAPAEGGGQTTTVDFASGRDQYPRAYRSGAASVPGAGAGIRGVDVPQRMAFQRYANHPSIIVDPRVVFDETYVSLRRDRHLDDTEATQLALAAAVAYVEKISDARMTKATPDLNNKLQKLQRELSMANNQVTGTLPTTPIAAQRSPNGGHMTGLGQTPHAVHAHARGVQQLVDPRTLATSPGAEETYTYTSADGTDHTFVKKVGGRFVPDLLGTLATLGLRELSMGGDWRAPYFAARVTISNTEGVAILHPDMQPPPPAEIDIAPGFSDVE